MQKKYYSRWKTGTGTRSSTWSARGSPTYHKRRGRSARPNRLNMRSSQAIVEAGAVHDGVAVANARAEATTAPVAVGVVAAEVAVKRPPAAVGAEGGGAT